MRERRCGAADVGSAGGCVCSADDPVDGLALVEIGSWSLSVAWDNDNGDFLKQQTRVNHNSAATDKHLMHTQKIAN